MPVYGTSQQQIIPLRRQYMSDPRYLQAQALMQSGSSTAPVQHWAQGAARLAQALSGRLSASALESEYEKRGKDYSQALATMLSAGQGTPGQEAAAGPYGIAAPAQAAQPGGLQSAIAAGLASRNEDILPLVQQLQLSQLEGQQKAETQKQLEEIKGRYKAPSLLKYNLGEEERSLLFTPGQGLAELGEAPRTALPRLLPPEIEAQRARLRRAGATNVSVNAQAPEFPGIYMTGYDEQGRPLFGVGKNPPLEKSTTAKLEDKVLQAQDSLANVNQILETYSPEYLTVKGQFTKSAIAGLEKLSPGSLTPEQRQFLGRATQFESAAQENLNNAIRQISGAAVSDQEAQRLRKQLPDAQRDSPTEFVTKTKQSASNLKRAMVRAKLAQLIGKDPLNSGIDLADTEKAIETWGRTQEQVIRSRNPGLSDEQIKAQVKAVLSEQFGR